jgi:hypothetical protein
MRVLSLGVALSIFFALSSAAAAEAPAPVDLTGSWTFTWDNDGKNTNPVILKHEAGTITGTYINDSKENCPVAGRLNSPANLILVVMCPGWDIKCDGAIEGSSAVAGQYAAYGNSSGTFKMARN